MRSLNILKAKDLNSHRIGNCIYYPRNCAKKRNANISHGSLKTTEKVTTTAKTNCVALSPNISNGEHTTVPTS